MPDRTPKVILQEIQTYQGRIDSKTESMQRVRDSSKELLATKGVENIQRYGDRTFVSTLQGPLTAFLEQQAQAYLETTLREVHELEAKCLELAEELSAAYKANGTPSEAYLQKTKVELLNELV